ncbi:HsdR family type I site-specific deoxyribonuclease [Vibrio natriegens]|nr:HsdR family type I site-specific deoxyribonuclease [Vibrio natriegens]
MKFTEAKLEQAIISLLGDQGYTHHHGSMIERKPEQVIIESDLRAYLEKRYGELTQNEISLIVRQLEGLAAGDLYESNKQFCKWLADGFEFKREDPTQKDLYIHLLDFSGIELLGSDKPLPPSSEKTDLNIYKVVNQLEIQGREYKRIPDGILYVNGLPLVVFEFKSAIRENDATIHDAYLQLTKDYRREIPHLFTYNAFCIISDGVNNKMGSLFADYEFFYAWRKVTGDESVEKDGIDSLLTMLNGLFHKTRLCSVFRDFIYFPDVSKAEVKIVCRYPQFYAANKLYHSVKNAQKPAGNGKGGTYFGATGCGKSFTMQFLARRLMKSLDFESPTIVFITDRNDLDEQLAKQICNAKTYIGDSTIETVSSREDLRTKLKGLQSGGVFLTTIQKFVEDIEPLTSRSNVICISDEAHRSQINLDQKLVVTDEGVRKSFGFAHYLHKSLPEATYVGFTGTPIDATLDVFGPVIDSYTMTESVKDKITVRLVYEGRAAKVLLDDAKLQEIERYYNKCAEQGSNEHQIEESKKAVSSINTILGDDDRIEALAADFVAHYEKRVEEGSTVRGKAMFVSSSREIAWKLYQQLQQLRPEWFEVKECEEGAQLTEKERESVKPVERVKLVVTSNKKKDSHELYELLKNSDSNKKLAIQFKNEKSNFKIAIVVDMWLTGFDVPFLDTIYIDKPIQKHNLIQTISRVNRTYAGKDKGLVVDYFGIKRQMNQAIAQFSKADESNFEDIQASVVVVKDHLELIANLLHKFDTSGYFSGDPVAQLDCLRQAADFLISTGKTEKRFMALAKRLKAAYDVCCGSENISQTERDQIHFYFAIRSIIFKLTKGDAPDTAQMNAKVRDMIAEAIRADGVEEIFNLGEDGTDKIDIFDDDYLARLDKLKLPNTKIELLKKMLSKALGEFQKVNQHKAMDFSKRFRALVEHYNERKEEDAFTAEVHMEAVNSFLDLMAGVKTEIGSFVDLGISIEEKAFYDILKHVAQKYQFPYEEERLLELAAKVKEIVDDKARYPKWNEKEDIKSALRVELMLLLKSNGYPPVTYAEVYKEVFEQAENFKANSETSLLVKQKKLTPIRVNDRTLFTYEQLKGRNDVLELATFKFKNEYDDFDRDIISLSRLACYEQVLEAGILSPSLLEGTLELVSQLEMLSEEEGLPRYTEKTDGIIWAVKNVDEGCIETEVVAFLGCTWETISSSGIQPHVDTLVYDLVKGGLTMVKDWGVELAGGFFGGIFSAKFGKKKATISAEIGQQLETKKNLEDEIKELEHNKALNQAELKAFQDAKRIAQLEEQLAKANAELQSVKPKSVLEKTSITEVVDNQDLVDRNNDELH